MRADSWDNDVLFLGIDQQTNTVRATTRSTCYAILDAMESEMAPLIRRIKTSSSSAPQVMIALGTNHPMLIYTILMCLRQGLSFALVPVNSPARELFQHMISRTPSVVVATAATLTEMSNFMRHSMRETTNITWKNKRRHTKMMEMFTEHLTENGAGRVGGGFGFQYTNFLDEKSAKLRKSAWISKTLSETTAAWMDSLLGFVAVGNSFFAEPVAHTFRERLSVPFLYHITHSDKFQTPLTVRDVMTYARHEPHPGMTVLMEGKPRLETLRFLPVWCARTNNNVNSSLELRGPTTALCEPVMETFRNQVGLHLSEQDAVDLMRHGLVRSEKQLPTDLKRSYDKLLQLQTEAHFYEELVKHLVNLKGQDVIHLTSRRANDLNSLVFNALLEELENVLPSDQLDSLYYDDICRFAQSRMDLTNESLKLQRLDFVHRFLRARQKGLIKIHAQHTPPAPTPVAHSLDTWVSINDVYIFGTVHPIICTNSGKLTAFVDENNRGHSPYVGK